MLTPMPAKSPATIPATLIPGDGIGPEIMDATLAALNADRVRTGDLGGNATTAQFTRALIKRIENAPNHID